MRRRTSMTLAATVIATALTGCFMVAPAPSRPVAAGAAGGERDPLIGRDWVFVEIDGFGGTLPSPPPPAGFILTSEARRMTGTTACNRMSSGYRLDGKSGALRFTNLVNTRMMCDRVAADTEEAVLAALLATDAYRLRDGALELLSRGHVVARLTQPSAR